MRHVQGYLGSHWTPPSSDYSLRIASAATRATANKTTTKNGPTLLAIMMAATVCQYDTTCIAQWRRSRVLVEAIGRCHWASIVSNNIKGTYLCQFLWMFFILNMLKTGA